MELRCGLPANLHGPHHPSSAHPRPSRKFTHELLPSLDSRVWDNQRVLAICNRNRGGKRATEEMREEREESGSLASLHTVQPSLWGVVGPTPGSCALHSQGLWKQS